MIKFKFERSHDRMMVELTLSISLIGLIAVMTKFFGL